jgi:hypothetical protein
VHVISNQPTAPATGDTADALDTLVEGLVEDALALLDGRIVPEDMPYFEAALYEFYETSPAAVQLIEQLRTAPNVSRSGAVAKSTDDALAEAFLRVSQKGGEGR